jgi:hypothetical protein
MNSRSERRLDQLEAQDHHLAVLSVENQRFTLLPSDFAEDEWQILHAVVWRMNADGATLKGILTALGTRELALWDRAALIVRGGGEVSEAAEQALIEAGQGSGRPRFSPSLHRGRLPVLIVTEAQDAQIRAGQLRLPSFVLAVILDNGRDQHAHLRRELEWLICRQ